MNSDIQEGTRLGVSGTPTFYINGRALGGAQPLPAFQKLIESDRQRQRVEHKPPRGGPGGRHAGGVRGG